MNKKFGVGALVASFAMSAVLASAQGINVQVNGNTIDFTNAQPQYIGGRVLVPLRGVFQEMGASVRWNPANRTVTADRGPTDVKLQIGQKWASLNGRTIALDVPAMILQGSTMVPIRFVSEALGAQVNWMSATQTVSISTTTAINTPPPESRPIRFNNRRRFMILRGTVIPVTLENRLSSATARRGDRFTARVNGFHEGNATFNGSNYDFPGGTLVEGHVISAVAHRGNRPGLLELGFDRVVLPDNQAFQINGSLIGLGSDRVSRDRNGILIARSNAKDNRMVYAGYGAGAGLLVGLASNKPVESLAVGGILGYIVGSIQQSQRHASEVVLPAGTRFGVRVNQSATVLLPIR